LQDKKILPNSMNDVIPTKEQVLAAMDRVRPHVHRTPILTSRSVNEISGAEIYFKCDNFQRMGAFKMRGAVNAILSLPKEALDRGVATHSSGNFAQALALSARSLGVKATVVMPENAPEVKKRAVAGYGAKIVISGSTPVAREKKLDEVVAQTGATFIHPSNDTNVILGNSTATQELLEDAPHLDYVMAPVGGGGLIAGTAMAVHYLSPCTKVIGAEPAQADDAYRSLETGVIQPSINPDTIADGLRTFLGDRNFPILQQFVERIILVEEQEIIDGMRIIWERMKIIVEPSATVTVGAVLKEPQTFQGKKIGIIICGGNVDIENLPF
jgi:threonine dehydratase